MTPVNRCGIRDRCRYFRAGQELALATTTNVLALVPEILPASARLDLERLMLEIPRATVHGSGGEAEESGEVGETGSTGESGKSVPGSADGGWVPVEP